MRSQRYGSLLGVILLTGVFFLILCPLFVSAAGPARSTTSGLFLFENADIQAVVKQVAALTGVTFLFDPEQVTGKITLLSPKDVSPAAALELLKSALALHGYALLSRPEGTWIIPAERVADEAFTVKVVRLNYARAGELAYTLSRVAPPSVRIIPHYPTNSLIISGHPAAVEELMNVIKWSIVDDITGTSVPQAINNQGQIVGVYADDLHAEVGFVLTNGTFVPLAAPGSFFQSYPWDIDDRGRIVGVIR